MFQSEYIPWAILVRWGRDVVGFKILIMVFLQIGREVGCCWEKATTYLTVVRCRSNGQKRQMADTPSSPTKSSVGVLARCPCIAWNIMMHFFIKHLLWLTHAGVIPCVKTNDILRKRRDKVRRSRAWWWLVVGLSGGMGMDNADSGHDDGLFLRFSFLIAQPWSYGR